jgi:hypothetical protein
MGMVISTHLPPPHRAPQVGDPHVVLELAHVLFGRCLFRERPGKHELGLEDGFGAFHDPV